MSREANALAVLKEIEPKLVERWMKEAVSQEDMTEKGDDARRLGAMKIYVFEQVKLAIQGAINE